MHIPQPTDSEAESSPDRFQFGLRSLLVLTVFCAVISAAAETMGGPLAFRAGVAFYLTILAVYGVLRIPQLCRQIRRDLRRQQQIWRECSDLVSRKRDEAPRD